ncbi:hypothetical protein K402DRAFT_332809 [Aulographum hederae CBS 113979]|uniref:F-box domain-containing protein n=1 Tax=Aulographum hederae CBS 113979 TaxID=1176131 RepID=A0A6G1H001_9PEZI|nr:hypothetical protein K402DRAFT_332809 [Aulographum hederae CBS 113979]
MPFVSKPPSQEQGWPKRGLATEILDHIAKYLSRDDMKALRLTSWELENHFSARLLHTVVVPFNTEIYGMIHEANSVVGHAIDVFKGFGPHIERFGMAFEIDPDSLMHPPEKHTVNRCKSYWGEYDWPVSEYKRFDAVAGLESAADETPKMKTAFSYFTKVKELALSIDSSLGWLNGPDVSLRSRINRQPPSVFGQSHLISDRKTQAQQQLWKYLQFCEMDKGSKGVLFTCLDDPDSPVLGLSVIPNRLSAAQLEWLLETEWAQRAFLMTYMVAVVDNPMAFQHVHTLNIARLSSRYLPLIDREDFWSALPQLHTVTLMVIADWRTVTKDAAGYVSTHSVNPRQAADAFHSLLTETIAEITSIKDLRIGWASGGEHAEGLHGRNQHVLPCPLIVNNAWFSRERSTPEHQRYLDALMPEFPHVENLTLINCWMTPYSVLSMVAKHRTASLKKLTFDSVSLTTAPLPEGNRHPVIPPLNPNPPYLGPFRDGSWPTILDVISPGKTLDDFNTPSSADRAILDSSNLEAISLISCGYTRVILEPWDQSALNFTPRPGSLGSASDEQYFEKKRSALSMYMMQPDRHVGAVTGARHPLFASIVPNIPRDEHIALEVAWEAEMGWADREKSFAATFDGCLPGGTGRFSAEINRKDRERIGQEGEDENPFVRVTIPLVPEREPSFSSSSEDDSRDEHDDEDERDDEDEHDQANGEVPENERGRFGHGQGEFLPPALFPHLY